MRHRNHWAGILGLFAAAACGGGSSSPNQGSVTAADLAGAQASYVALNSTFSAVPLFNLASLSPDMATVFPAPPAPPPSAGNQPVTTAVSTPLSALTRYLNGVIRSARRPAGLRRAPVAFGASIPGGLLGKTFEWDPNASAYADLGTAGAPADGVRFIVYQVDASGQVDPLNLIEVATLDMTDAGLNTAADSGQLAFSLLVGNASYGSYGLAYQEGTTSPSLTGGGEGTAMSAAGQVHYLLQPFEIGSDSSVRVNVAQLDVDANLTGTPQHFFAEDGTLSPCPASTISTCADFVASFSQHKLPDNVAYGFNGSARLVAQNLSDIDMTVTIGGTAVARITMSGSNVVINDPSGNPIAPGSNTAQFVQVVFLDASLVNQAVDLLLAPAFAVVPNGDLINLPY
jgi:hypothetical protein